MKMGLISADEEECVVVSRLMPFIFYLTHSLILQHYK